MIPEDWAIDTLGSNVDKIFCGRDPSGGKQSHSNEITQYRIIQSAPVFDGYLNNEKVGNISKEMYHNLESASLRENDVLLNQLGDGITFARSCVVSKEVLPAIITRSVGCIRCNQQKLDPWFLNAFLILPKTKKYIESFNSGSSRRAIDGGKMRSFLIPIPPIDEQRKIGFFYKTIQSKLELNRSMNYTLEAIGQALFKHWFVDFEFPNEEGKPYRSSGGEMVKTELGEVPKGWEVAKLNEIAEFIRGFSYAGSEKSKVSGDNVFVTLNSIYEGGGFKREFSYLTSDRVKERHLVKEGDIIIANTEQTKTGTLLGFPALVEFPLNYDKIVGVFSHHITKVIPFREEVKHFLYHYLYFYQTNAIKYHTGSVIWALDVNGWTNNEKIILPKKEILITFSKLMNSIFQKKLKNNIESNTLENIRDALLPKLMSGEIRVKVSENEAAK